MFLFVGKSDKWYNCQDKNVYVYIFILSVKIFWLLYHLPLSLITLVEIAFISDRSISFWTGYGKLIFVQMFLPFRIDKSSWYRDIIDPTIGLSLEKFSLSVNSNICDIGEIC